MKIVLAEDDTDLGNVLAQFLHMHGYEVHLAAEPGMELNTVRGVGFIFKVTHPD